MLAIKVGGKKDSNFFVPSGNELSYIIDTSNVWNTELFAMVYRMLNVLYFMFDIYWVHMLLLTYQNNDV